MHAFLLSKKTLTERALKGTPMLVQQHAPKGGPERIYIKIKVGDTEKSTCSRAVSHWINERCKTPRDWVRNCGRTKGSDPCTFEHDSNSWPDVKFDFSFPQYLSHL